MATNLAQVHIFLLPEIDSADLDSSALGTIGSSSRRVANLHDSDGHYYVANGDGSGIRVRRANGYTPRTDSGLGGFVLDTHATSDPSDVSPALIEDYRGWIKLYYESSASVLSVLSGDRGVTWNSPMSEMPGILPAACRARDEQNVLVAVQGDNSLLVTVQFSGDRWPNDNHTGSSEGTSSDAPYVAVDPSNNPIITDGTGVALSPMPDGRVEMALVVSGDSDLSHWWSGNKKCNTWRQVT